MSVTKEQYEKIEALMRSVFLIADEGIIKLLCAFIIANRLPFDPVWLFIVGPSGSGKTEMITALNDVLGVYPLSTVTSHTFISGQKKTGVETSLLFKIKEGIISFKDFTSILSLQNDERKEIMAQLREIYDGALTKSFGSGKDVVWKGKIGLLAGVTGKIYTAQELYAAMGERFVMYAPAIPNRIEATRRAMGNTSIIRDSRLLIRATFKEFLDNTVGVPLELEEVPEIVTQEINLLSEFSTRARSPVERNWMSSGKEITFVYDPEMPTRFASQLVSLAHALMILNEEQILTSLDRHILYKIALDSITATRRKALQELARYAWVYTAGLAAKLNYPTQTVQRWLEDLNVLEVITRHKEKNRNCWRIKDEYRLVMERFDNITPEARDLDEKTALESQPELLPISPGAAAPVSDHTSEPLPPAFEDEPF